MKNSKIGIMVLSLLVLMSMGCSSQPKKETEWAVDLSDEANLEKWCNIGTDLVAESEQKNYACTEDTSCEWRYLGGKLESHYSCCPKDVKALPDEIITKYFSRCFLVVD